MTAIRPENPFLGDCPICGAELTAISETRESTMLCTPRTDSRRLGEVWRRYEPCGHED